MIDERIRAIWKEILGQAGWHTPNINVGSKIRRDALLSVNDYLISLESRIAAAETLASLVQTYITESGMRKTAPVQAIAHMLELAREIYPQGVTVNLGSGAMNRETDGPLPNGVITSTNPGYSTIADMLFVENKRKNGV